MNWTTVDVVCTQLSMIQYFAETKRHATIIAYYKANYLPTFTRTRVYV